MKKGATILGVLLFLVIAFFAVLFYIPYSKVLSDKMEIKRALNATKDYIKGSPGVTDNDIASEFFAELDKDKLTVVIYPEDFEVKREEGNVFVLRFHYVNDHIIVPILKLKLKDIDKYIETDEFGY